MAPLTGVSDLLFITLAYNPLLDGGFPFPNLSGFFPLSTTLTLSGLSQADLTDTSYTLVLMGDGYLKATYADGGPNPLSGGWRLIRNDAF